MEILLFIAIIVCAGLIICFKSGVLFSDHVFNEPPAGARAEFLERAFGITREDCVKLHFDGYNFQHRFEVPYCLYTTLRVTGSRMVRVWNRELPHTTSWKFQRVDGGPDRRYSGNAEYMHSKRYDVAFNDPSTFVLPVYCHPIWDDMHDCINRFRTFLIGAREQDYEEEFTIFSDLHERCENHRRELNRLQKQVSACEKVVTALETMPVNAVIPNELIEKAHEARVRLAALRIDVESSEQFIVALERQKDDCIEKTRSRCAIAVSCEEIASFADSYS